MVRFNRLRRLTKIQVLLGIDVVLVAGVCPDRVTGNSKMLGLRGPTDITATQGGSSDVEIRITRTNWAGLVTLEVTGAPAGTTATLLPVRTTTRSSMLQLQIGSVAVGTYPLTVRGTGDDGLVGSATVNVRVVP